MKIGRKDDKEKREAAPAGPAADASPRDGDVQRESVPAFDWSKVKGGATSSSGDVAPPKKEKKKPKSSEGDDKTKTKFQWPLSRNETYLAAAIVLLLVGIVYFAFLRGDPGLRPSLTNSELQKMSQEATKEMVDRVTELEKQFGPDNPEVQQQKEMLKQLRINAQK